MSGIYIPGLAIPEDGWHKVIKIFSDGAVASYYDSVELAKAIPVPEHGRLIDADALFKKARFRMGIKPGGIDEVEAFIRVADLLDAPTIIPADKEGEG